MAGGKETPRQKMIGMMYLVLTALLALNVSDQVLNAFKLVNDGLEKTTSNFSEKNNFTYKAFESAMTNNPGKTKPFKDKADQAKKYCEELYKYIGDLKLMMIEKGGGYDKESHDIVDRKNLDIAAEIMLTRGKGPELKKKIVDTRKNLLALIEPKDRNSINFNLNAVDPPSGGEGGLAQTWESSQFEGVPLTAAVTLLSKLQNDVKNAEGEIANYLLKSIDANDFKFDQLRAVVVANTSYLLVGQQYEADVFLTAYDSKQSPDIYVGGSKLNVEDGMGKYKVVPGSENPSVKWGGVIKVKSPDGTFKDYEFKSEYQVAKPTAVVSADKMNVVYIGVPNPISISAPGIPKEKIKAKATIGELSGSNGKYIFTLPPGTTAAKTIINVSAEIKPGEVKTLGAYEYRIRTVPNPNAKFANITSGSLSGSLIKAQPGVFAELENFDFDLKFNVTKFSLIILKKGQDARVLTATGPALTPDMKESLSNLGSKDRIQFDDIYAKGPDGISRRLNPIVISVQ